MFKLVISDDEGKTTSVPLGRDEITIGRKEGNTIRLTDRNVSRRHARLQKQNGHYLLHDLGSYNGIVINGARLVDAQPLKSGDQILIGDYKLAILEENTSQVAVPPPAPSSIHDTTLDAAPTTTMQAPPPAPPPPAHATAPAIPSAMPVPPPPAPMMAPLPPAAMVAPSVPPATAMPSGPEVIPAEIRQMRLVFLAPAGAPAPVSLDRLPLILGRSEAADIALPYSSISREHARLSIQGGSLIIEDLGSSNGVLVNGNKAPRAVVGAGDLVTLGVVEFRIARRGEDTVILDRDPGVKRPTAEPSKRTPLIAGAGVAVLLAVVGGVVIAMRSGGSAQHPTAGAATAPELSATAATPAAPGAPSTAPAAPVAPSAPENPTPAEPTAPPSVAAVAPTPAAPETAPQPAAPPPATHQPLLAMANTPPTHAAEPRHAHDHAAPAPTAAAHAAAAPPPPESHPAPPPPQTHPAAATTTSNSGSANNSGTSGGAAATSSGDALAQARQCHGDNQCVVSALQGRAQTEQELGMLAVTYRLMANRGSAVRTMNQYLRRFPTGPRAESFRTYLENQ
jgi:pSer/pThr/pTyr-binding forkhead associated (FHA) protein